MTSSIEIRGWLPPGLNGKLGLERMHWATKKRMREALEEKVADWYDREDTPIDLVLSGQQVRATYTRYSVRLMDVDNLAASCKLPFDALRDAYLTPDDNPYTIVSLTCHQEKVDHLVDQGFKLEFEEVS